MIGLLFTFQAFADEGNQNHSSGKFSIKPSEQHLAVSPISSPSTSLFSGISFDVIQAFLPYIYSVEEMPKLLLASVIEPKNFNEKNEIYKLMALVTLGSPVVGSSEESISPEENPLPETIPEMASDYFHSLSKCCSTRCCSNQTETPANTCVAQAVEVQNTCTAPPPDSCCSCTCEEADDDLGGWGGGGGGFGGGGGGGVAGGGAGFVGGSGGGGGGGGGSGGSSGSSGDTGSSGSSSGSSGSSGTTGTASASSSTTVGTNGIPNSLPTSGPTASASSPSSSSVTVSSSGRTGMVPEPSQYLILGTFLGIAIYFKWRKTRSTEKS